MREKILEDLKTAMKNQNKELLSVIRMVKGAIQMEELNLKRELLDSEILDVLSKQIKMRKESLVEFEKGKRQDLINKTQKEIDILNKYMPKPLTQEEIDKIIDDTFNQLKPTNIKEMGRVMKDITPKVKGKVDMSEVSKKVRNRLN